MLLVPDERIIVKMKFGSHLYGTATPESDTDFKGVFLPSKEEILLGRIPKSISLSTKKGDLKNTSQDVDTELYSLHYFIKLACDGETAAMDMLHAPESMLLATSDIWKAVIIRRHRFYTKNLKAFVGYARKQASKYGVRGSRLNDASRVIEFFTGLHSSALTLSEVWDALPSGEHIFKYPARPEHNNKRLYEVCGRKIPESAQVSYANSIVYKFYSNYGERAVLAAKNEGIDWKAVSHAFRAAFQVKEILTEEKITFPLKEAEYLLAVKQGKLDYLTEVAPRLDELMAEVEKLSEKSLLPMEVDRGYWDTFIYSVCHAYLTLNKPEATCR